MRPTTEPHHAAFSGSHNGAGLTKREWYAGMALQGILAADPPVGLDATLDGTRRAIVELAVGHADELIAALNERTS